jgi:O-succinylbenzoic acid--CoA ligase
MIIRLNNLSIDLSKTNWNNLKKYNNSDWWIDIVDFLQQWTDNSPYVNINTSGSTGTPKTIYVKKTDMKASAQMTNSFFKLSNNTTGLLCLSAKYIAGKMMIVRGLESNMKLICTEPTHNPIKFIDEKIDFTAMVPYQVNESIKDTKFSLIKNLIIGGGKVQNSLIEKLNNTPVNSFETFGMTETLSHIALKELSPIHKEYFTTLDGVSISQGSNSEMIINAKHLGIKNLKTTDIIELISDKKFIWKGRLDFIINSGGIKINPEEIESKIHHLIPSKFCIIGTPDKKFGEKITLIIENPPFDTVSIKNEMKKILPDYHHPKEIIFLNKFPLTQTGKINISKLKEIL